LLVFINNDGDLFAFGEAIEVTFPEEDKLSLTQVPENILYLNSLKKN